jgi:glycosyltransferase involved in cell wall biosynthesis
MKILLCGTHPQQCNAYARLTHALADGLSLTEGVEVVVFGFQNNPDVSSKRRALDPSVTVIDAQALDRGGQGFGLSHLPFVVSKHRPDCIVVINDAYVIAKALDVLSLHAVTTPLIAYLQLVYECLRPSVVSSLNRCAAVVASSDRWTRHLAEQGVTTPTYTVGRGVDPVAVYPVPQDIARRFLRMSEDEFVVLNLNRNTLRKRWDVCMAAWARVVVHYTKMGGRYPRLLVGADISGAWDLLYVYSQELIRNGVEPEVGLKHIMRLGAGHTLSDFQVNALYNASDVGVSIGDGHGFGMCAVEHGAVGRPVVASAVGGHVANLREDAVILVPARVVTYVDGGRIDGGGRAEIVAANDVADALIGLMSDPGRCERLGATAQRSAPRWSTVVADMLRVIQLTVSARPVPSLPEEPNDPPFTRVQQQELDRLAHGLQVSLQKLCARSAKEVS